MLREGTDETRARHGSNGDVTGTTLTVTVTVIAAVTRGGTGSMYLLITYF